LTTKSVTKLVRIKDLFKVSGGLVMDFGWKTIIAFSLVTGLVGTVIASPTSYSGSLSYVAGSVDGLLAVPSGNVWNSPTTTLS